MSTLFNDTDRMISDALRRKGAAFLPALMQRMNFLMLRFQKYVQEQKLSGQVLNARSGNLRDSVRVVPAAISGGVIKAGVQAAGGPAWYGRLHEYGVDHEWLIVAKNRKSLAFEIAGQMLFRKSVVHPPLPARSFMGSSATELTPEINASLQSVVRTAGE